MLKCFHTCAAPLGCYINRCGKGADDHHVGKVLMMIVRSFACKGGLVMKELKTDMTSVSTDFNLTPSGGSATNISALIVSKVLLIV